MYAPVTTRFRTYGVQLDAASQKYCDTILAMPFMKEWQQGTMSEPEDIEELEMEF